MRTVRMENNDMRSAEEATRWFDKAHGGKAAGACVVPTTNAAVTEPSTIPRSASGVCHCWSDGIK